MILRRLQFAAVITGITFAFTFYVRCISVIIIITIIIIIIIISYFSHDAKASIGPEPPLYRDFTAQASTLDRTPLAE
jgi:hypothetical protein